MRKFRLFVIGNYSPNILTFGRCKNTCYELEGLDKKVYLDFGAGIFFKFLRRIKSGKIDLNDIIIVISHNHVDHSFSLFFLSLYLYIHNKRKKEKKKIKVILPNKSLIFRVINSFRSVFDIEMLNEDYMMNIGDVKFTFCQTIHKGESYATKISYKGKEFVYTSDIAEISEKLTTFIQNADTVLVDAGYPIKLSRTFCKYHGRTKEILEEVNKCSVKKILATHIRFFSLPRDYYKRFPKNSDTKLVKINHYYDLFH